jgi:hypothetical protein
MNVRKLVDELTEIKNNPRARSVTVAESGYRTTYTFHDHYYYPAGIVRIELQRGGAGVIYVYTTADPYPHLTIPFDGANIHWTTAPHNQSHDWPDDPIGRFLALFP